MSLPKGVYSTAAGSTVKLSGRHGGIAETAFDWFEEPDACCECRVDPYPQDGRLTWECDYCGGGSAELAVTSSEWTVAQLPPGVKL